MKGGRVSPWPLVLALVLLLTAMGTLLWLRSRLLESMEADLVGAGRRFEATGVLGRPESNAIVFADVESLVDASTGKLIRRLYVTKVVREGEEVAVVPFHADLTEPGWREATPWRRIAVGPESSGYLYIDMDTSIIVAVNAAISVLGLMLAVGLAVLILRQRRKEVQVGELQSELAERQAQVIRLERLALAGQLSANIFHDIKKPVLNIKHEVSDALDDPEASPVDVMRSVRAQTELFMQMLRDLGMEAFVNPGAETREWCDLHDAAERAIRLVRYEQSGIDVRTRFDDGIELLIEGYPHHFVQLLSNLILNSYQALGNSGIVLVAGHTRDGWIEVSVEDSGPGIPTDKRDAIFSPFVTGRGDKGGSGLGLYICRTIVEDLGGTISVGSSGELGGARFLIRLPTAES